MKSLRFVIAVLLVHTAVATEFKWMSLKGKTAYTSDLSAEGVVDGNVSTHVNISSDSLVVDLRSVNSSELWRIDSVRITPARPMAKTGFTGGADKKNTSKCIFPFKKLNVVQNKCADSGFGFKQCSYGEHLELSDWSSCNDYRPDGSLSDNIEVSTSLSNDLSNSVYCGRTDNSSFNAKRTVKCPHNVTQYLVFSKTGNMRIAEIDVKASIFHFQCNFSSKLEPVYSGCSGENVTAFCAVDCAYPHPSITMTLGSTTLPTVCRKKYDGEKSLNCSVEFRMKSEYNNEPLICRVEQGDVKEYAQESRATVQNCETTSTTLPTSSFSSTSPSSCPPSSPPQCNCVIFVLLLIFQLLLIIILIIIIILLCCRRSKRRQKRAKVNMEIECINKSMN